MKVCSILATVPVSLNKPNTLHVTLIRLTFVQNVKIFCVWFNILHNVEMRLFQRARSVDLNLGSS